MKLLNFLGLGGKKTKPHRVQTNVHILYTSSTDKKPLFQKLNYGSLKNTYRSNGNPSVYNDVFSNHEMIEDDSTKLQDYNHLLGYFREYTNSDKYESFSEFYDEQLEYNIPTEVHNFLLCDAMHYVYHYEKHIIDFFTKIRNEKMFENYSDLVQPKVTNYLHGFNTFDFTTSKMYNKSELLDHIFGNLNDNTYYFTASKKENNFRCDIGRVILQETDFNTLLLFSLDIIRTYNMEYPDRLELNKYKLFGNALSVSDRKGTILCTNYVTLFTLQPIIKILNDSEYDFSFLSVIKNIDGSINQTNFDHRQLIPVHNFDNEDEHYTPMFELLNISNILTDSNINDKIKASYIKLLCKMYYMDTNIILKIVLNYAKSDVKLLDLFIENIIDDINISSIDRGALYRYYNNIGGSLSSIKYVRHVLKFFKDDMFNKDKNYTDYTDKKIQYMNMMYEYTIKFIFKRYAAMTHEVGYHDETLMRQISIELKVFLKDHTQKLTPTTIDKICSILVNNKLFPNWCMYNVTTEKHKIELIKSGHYNTNWLNEDTPKEVLYLIFENGMYLEKYKNDECDWIRTAIAKNTRDYDRQYAYDDCSDVRCEVASRTQDKSLLHNFLNDIDPVVESLLDNDYFSPFRLNPNTYPKSMDIDPDTTDRISSLILSMAKHKSVRVRKKVAEKRFCHDILINDESYEVRKIVYENMRQVNKQTSLKGINSFKEVDINTDVAMVCSRNLDNVIGYDLELVHRVKEDLSLFKEITIHGTVIMGRNTFMSIGDPLPDRHSIVITSNHENLNILNDYPNVTYVDSLENAIELGKFIKGKSGGNKGRIFVIGGAKVYTEALQKDLVDTVYLTTFHSHTNTLPLTIQEKAIKVDFSKVIGNDCNFSMVQQFYPETKTDSGLVMDIKFYRRQQKDSKGFIHNGI